MPVLIAQDIGVVETEHVLPPPLIRCNLIRMRSETFRDAAVAAKYKILAALAIVVATKCEPCIKGYIKMAYEAGTTQAELIEFLNVAITESGCPGEQWAMIALKTYDELESGKTVNADIYCHDDNAI